MVSNELYRNWLLKVLCLEQGSKFGKVPSSISRLEIMFNLKSSHNFATATDILVVRLLLHVGRICDNV